MRAIVVGGGIAGLTAAWRLTERARAAGRSVELSLLEAEARPGGHAMTTVEDGFLIEAGPNAFLQRPRETHMLELARGLGIEPRLVEARAAAKRRFVLLGGRLHRAPDSPPALISSGVLSPLGKLRLLMEPWAKRAPRDREETVYDFARRRIGREAAERLVDAAVAGISAGDSRKLSVSAAFPLMIEMEREHGSLIRAMMARRREGTSRLLGFDGGMETLVGALRSRLGGALRTSCRASAVHRKGKAWRVSCENGSTFEAEQIVLAVSAARAAALLESFHSALARELRSVPYAGIAVVALAYRLADIARPLDGYGYLVTAGEGLDTLGVLWESSLFEGRAPEGHALLRVMMGGSRRPGVPSLDEVELITRARRELQGPMGVTAEPVRTWVRRWPNAIAQYVVGHAGRVEEARQLAGRHAGLDLCGSSYDGASFGSAALSGLSAGDRVWARLGSEALVSGRVVGDTLAATAPGSLAGARFASAP